MGLHVVVPGLIELTSRNKFVQRIYVHVHVRIFLNRKMFVHPCYAFIYNKKTPENWNNSGTWRQEKKHFLRQHLFSKVWYFLRQWWILRDGWNTHNQPRHASMQLLLQFLAPDMARNPNNMWVAICHWQQMETGSQEWLANWQFWFHDPDARFTCENQTWKTCLEHV